MPLEPPFYGQLNGHWAHVREDVCTEGKVPELVHALRAVEPVLKWPPYFKLHTYGPHLTQCNYNRMRHEKKSKIRYKTSSCQSKLSDIRGMPFSASFHSLPQPLLGLKLWYQQEKGALSFPAQAHSHPLWEYISICNKSMLCLLLLRFLSNSLLNFPRTWLAHKWEVPILPGW
jgi:hypothetical protein